MVFIIHLHNDINLLIFLRGGGILEVRNGLLAPARRSHVGEERGRLDSCEETLVTVEWAAFHSRWQLCDAVREEQREREGEGEGGRERERRGERWHEKFTVNRGSS